MKKNKQQIKDRFTSRRQFLAGAGTFLTLPPLLSLMPRTVAAQVGAQKKVRSVIYAGFLGIDQHQLVLTANPGFTTHPGSVYTNYKQLNTISGQFSRMIDSSFVGMYPHMNIIKGLSLCGGQYQGHNNSILSGTHSGGRTPIYGKSIDVIMEQSANVYPAVDNVPYKALRIGGDAFSFDRVGGTAINSSYLQGDTALFNKVFAGLTGGPVIVPQQQQTNSKLVVDQVYNDLKSLEGSTKLSGEDRTILNRFIAGIYDVQKKVQATNSGTSKTCSKPTLPLDANATGNSYQFPFDPGWGVQSTSVVFDNYIEMIRLAFECDLTRVVVIQNSIWSDLPVSPTSSGGLHHECASSELAADRHQWGLKKMLKLAQNLQATSDPQGGTLLDNSTILFTNELGAWTTSHNVFSLPAVMFGGGGGLFKTGYYVDYSQLNRPNWKGVGFTPGRPYKQLLQSIMSSMGVPKSEYMQFGDGNGFGEFKEDISQFNKSDPGVFSAYRNEHNDLLPFLVS